MTSHILSAALASITLLLGGCASPGDGGPVNVVEVAPGWAKNSVNAVVFRKNSLVSHGDTQYIAFYDQDANVVLGKRQLGTARWQLARTQYRGNAADAHNSISIMVDGDGFLHIAWDHHNDPLRYARSLQPGSLALGEKGPMVGVDEGSVSYPEFHLLPGGDLLFFYRDGGSGRGNLVLNRYDRARATWTRVHSNLISGEQQRNAYWQAFVDQHGTIHVSWVWRESPDVASNHDLAYARSVDEGRSWQSTSGTPYRLPITASNAEYAARIPQNSELINQTSMAADKRGNPYIASYWRAAGQQIPQYHVVYHTGSGWRQLTLNFRKTPFSLSGQGTKAIPISRPQIMVDTNADRAAGLLVFRDEERGSRVSVVRIEDFDGARWLVRDLSESSVGAWEPSFDTQLWRRRAELHLYAQRVRQADAEGVEEAAPTQVQVLEWTPAFNK
jgi:hypothetical protein